MRGLVFGAASEGAPVLAAMRTLAELITEKPGKNRASPGRGGSMPGGSITT
ncbi:hypothetical protein [Nocardia brevicatena]|uniref:hypothetical protein n=1 Tax=Nocardia brevicatena TaxID=37327 RepID=UPI001FE0A94F|nr:hypothetical protein [Nocardia brevicatena]